MTKDDFLALVASQSILYVPRQIKTAEEIMAGQREQIKRDAEIDAECHKQIEKIDEEIKRLTERKNQYLNLLNRGLGIRLN